MYDRKTILVTGGAGFIGSELVRHLIAESDYRVVVVDKLTYAANLAALKLVAASPRYHFIQVDIADRTAMDAAFAAFRPDGVLHLAAESHVDRSIDGPAVFIQTNIVGTFVLLEAALAYWRGLGCRARETFRFLHISTDEVYGSLGQEGAFHEDTPYNPSSPYSASKASSDHLVAAWHRTFGLPVVMTNCSNNYGPYQFPEKLVPLMTLNAVAEKPLPIYGTGQNVRDWLHVADHARALCYVFERGLTGEKYNVGGRAERTNMQVVHTICTILDEIRPRAKGSYDELIRHVADRPGHDHRYAIDSTKIERELGFRPAYTFETGFRQTVEWILDHLDYYTAASKTYQQQRLGVLKAPAVA